jgi:hypothetical protein
MDTISERIPWAFQQQQTRTFAQADTVAVSVQRGTGLFRHQVEAFEAMQG